MRIGGEMSSQDTMPSVSPADGGISGSLPLPSSTPDLMFVSPLSQPHSQTTHDKALEEALKRREWLQSQKLQLQAQIKALQLSMCALIGYLWFQIVKLEWNLAHYFVIPPATKCWGLFRVHPVSPSLRLSVHSSWKHNSSMINRYRWNFSQLQYILPADVHKWEYSSPNFFKGDNY